MFMVPSIKGLEAIRERSYRQTLRAFDQMRESRRHAEDHDRRVSIATAEVERHAQLIAARSHWEDWNRATAVFMTASIAYMKAVNELRDLGVFEC